MFWSNKPKAEKLFASWPPTRILKDEVKIKADYFTPEKKKTADTVAVLIGFLGAVVGFFGASDSGGNPLVGILVGVCIGAWLGHQAKNNFKITTEIEFTPEFIRIPSGWGFKNYDRKMQHGFSMELHEKAEKEEEDEMDEKDRKRSNRHKNPKYYRDAYQVFMEYLGERVYFADVHERKPKPFWFDCKAWIST